MRIELVVQLRHPRRSEQKEGKAWDWTSRLQQANISQTFPFCGTVLAAANVEHIMHASICDNRWGYNPAEMISVRPLQPVDMGADVGDLLFLPV